MAFVHPVLGAVAVLYVLWIASRGLVARQGATAAHRARRTHKRWAKWGLLLMALAVSTGISSTLLVRPDLMLGETWHLVVGLSVLGLMGLGALLTRQFVRQPWLRAVHLAVGIATVAAAITQAILGIELLP